MDHTAHITAVDPHAKRISCNKYRIFFFHKTVLRFGPFVVRHAAMISDTLKRIPYLLHSFPCGGVNDRRLFLCQQFLLLFIFGFRTGCLNDRKCQVRTFESGNA